MTEDPIVYQDKPGQRVLDLRPHGVTCIPVLGFSDFHAIQVGTDFHIHPKDIEICLCVRGNLAFETAERTYPFLPGSLFVSTEREPHRMRYNPKGLLVYRILFRVPKSDKTILGLTRSETEWIVRSLLHLPKRLFKSTPRVKNAFTTLFDVYDDKRLSAARRVKLKAGVLDLLVGVIEAARLLPNKAPDRISVLMKMMRDQPEQDYPIGGLAQKAALSPSAFSETFKRAAGLPPHAYLISCRIARAQKMLATGKHAIRDVADFLRFSSPQHFSNTFKHIVGMTPAACLKRGQVRDVRQCGRDTWGCARRQRDGELEITRRRTAPSPKGPHPRGEKLPVVGCQLPNRKTRDRARRNGVVLILKSSNCPVHSSIIQRSRLFTENCNYITRQNPPPP